MCGVFLCICFALSLTKTEARITSPTGLNVTNINVTTVVARWNPITREHVQGVLVGYILQLHKHNSPQFFRTPETKETSIVIKDLQPSVDYLLSVQGYTANETGMPSYRFFSIPVIPSPTGLSVTKVNVSTVTARWDPIPKEQIWGIFLGYNVQLRDYYSGQLLQTNKTNETSIYIVIKDLKDWSQYRLDVYGYTLTRTGGSSSYSFYTSTMTSPTGVTVTNINVTTVAAGWNPILKEHVRGVLLGYNVRLCNQYPGQPLQTLKTKETSIVVKHLQPNVYYRLLVQGYTVNETGRSSYSSFSIPVVPRTSGLTITKINATTVLARWNPILKGQVWGVLVGYHVQLRDSYSWQLLQTNKTNETSILLKDLKEWLRYRMQVYGYTSTNTGSSSYYYFYTSPIMRLSGFNVTIINSTAVVARWDPIPREHVFGNLIVYHLRLYAYNFYKYFKTNETNIVVKDLQPGHSYRLYVYGYTANDTGEESYYNFVTQCGGILKNQLQRNITIQLNTYYYYYYHYWPTFNCTWEIQGQSSNSIILIVLESIYTIPSYQCRNGYLEISDGQGQLLSRLCGSRNTSMNFVSIGSAKIHFHALMMMWWWWYSSYIKKISFSYFTFNNGIDNALVKKSWTISASSNSSSSIAVQWTKYPGQGSVNTYIAVCIARNNHNNISSAQTDGQNFNVVVKELLKNTEYNVVVLAFMKKSFNATIWNATILNEAIWKSRAVVTKTMAYAPAINMIPTKKPPTEEYYN